MVNFLLSPSDDVSLLSEFPVCIHCLIISVDSLGLDTSDLVILVIEIAHTLQQLLSIVPFELHVPALNSVEVDVLSCCLRLAPLLGCKVLFLEVLI